MAVITIDKFNDVFESMNRNIVFQSSMLESLLAINQDTLKMEKEQMLDEQRRQRQLDLERTFNDDDQRYNKPGDTMLPDVPVVPQIGPPSEVQTSSFWDALLPGIGVFAGSVLRGATVPKLIGGAIWGTVAIAMGKHVEDFLSGFVEKSSLDAGASEAFSAEFGKYVGTAAHWGMIGMIFGKKVGLMFAVGSVFKDKIESVINSKFDENGDKMTSAFGLNLSNDIWSTIAAGIAGVITVASIMPILRGTLWVGGVVGGQILPGIMSKMTSGFALKFGAAGIMFAASGYIGAAITEWTNSKELGDATSAALKGASFGALLGPAGAVVGAMAGLAVSALSVVGGWLRDRDAGIRDAFIKKMKGVATEVDENGITELSDEKMNTLLDAKFEIERGLNMNLGKAAKEELDNAYNILVKTLEQVGDALSSEVVAKRYKELMLTDDASDKSELMRKQLIEVTEAINERLDEKDKIDLSTQDGFDVAIEALRRRLIFAERSNNAAGEALSNVYDVLDTIKPADFKNKLDSIESKVQRAESAGVIAGSGRGTSAGVIVDTSSGGSQTNNSNNSSVQNNNYIVQPSRSLDFIDHY